MSTPRTDACLATVETTIEYHGEDDYKRCLLQASQLADLARTLERENAELRNLVDRALKILWCALPDSQLVHSDSNNPIAEWVADAQAIPRSGTEQGER